jgi:hypothetical protein
MVGVVCVPFFQLLLPHFVEGEILHPFAIDSFFLLSTGELTEENIYK